MEQTPLQQLAQEASDCFTTKERETPAGTQVYWIAKDGTPQWIMDMVHLVHKEHENGLPDDYTYDYIVDALEQLAEYEDADNAHEGLESDVYTSSLTEWLASDVLRVGYLTEALETFGPTDGIQALQDAQMLERREVLELVQKSLESRLVSSAA